METLFTSVYRPENEKKDGNKKNEDEEAVNIFANILSNKQIAEDDDVLTKEEK